VRILALDLSINCPGYCIGDNDQYITSGFQQNNPRATVYSRIEANIKLIDTLITQHSIQAVWIEDIAGTPSRAVAAMLCEQAGIVKYFCRVRKIPVSVFGIKSIKLYMTGSGAAEKSDMITAVQSRGFPQVTQNDEADAISCWLYGLDQPFIMTCNE
jgi:Holliday junction resolvasome RuvABC endonuclease subunit